MRPGAMALVKTLLWVTTVPFKTAMSPKTGQNNIKVLNIKYVKCLHTTLTNYISTRTDTVAKFYAIRSNLKI